MPDVRARLRVTAATAATVAVAAGSLLAAAPAHAAGRTLLTGRLHTRAAAGVWAQHTVHAGWKVVFNGYGSVRRVADARRGVALQLDPARATRPSVTHAALVVSTRAVGDHTFEADERTVTQLRTGSGPNAWEVAWVVWHYRDNAHFYYLLLKPNGWELGKEDPAYPGNQRFLATGSDHRFAVGSWHHISVRQVGNRITAAADGHELVTAVDRERPYLTGAVGLYTEDAQARFSRIRVRALS